MHHPSPPPWPARVHDVDKQVDGNHVDCSSFFAYIGFASRSSLLHPRRYHSYLFDGIDFRPENFGEKGTRIGRAFPRVGKPTNWLAYRRWTDGWMDGWVGNRTIEQPRAEGQTLPSPRPNASSFLLTKILATDRRINVPLKALAIVMGNALENERGPRVFEKRIRRAEAEFSPRMREPSEIQSTPTTPKVKYLNVVSPWVELPTFPKNAINPCLTSINSVLFHFFHPSLRFRLPDDQDPKTRSIQERDRFE